MKPQHKTLALWIFIMLLFAFMVKMMDQKPSAEAQINYSDFVRLVKENQINDVTFKGPTTIIGKFKPTYEKGTKFKLTGNTGEYTVKLLADNKLVPNYEDEEKQSFLTSLLLSWGPMIVLLVLFYVFLRQLQGGGGKAMSFGKSKARLIDNSTKKITFNDVAGIEEAKDELVEIVDFLKDPKKYSSLGGKIPKGVILVGPPGTGKTLLARAIAGEADVPFFSISGSDFVEMFVGVGASRVRDLFEQGKKNAPCIIFIDEIDAVGRHRGAGLGGGHDEREQTLNQLLVEMDGFEANDGVILIAATNRMDVLDPALLRPGRFDRRVYVHRPDVRGRVGILKVHTQKVPIAEDVQLEVIAKGTPGFTGADLANLVNEAALLAARDNKKSVTMFDFEHAKDKVMMGAERKSMVISDAEKKVTAYHEAGHALVGMHLEQMDPIHKITIIPRGGALGLTQTLPDEERLNLNRTRARNFISFLMGGRVAEELIFNEITSGAMNDIERATELARNMICHWGMSEKMGPVAWGSNASQPFMGMGTQENQYSSNTAKEIDQEVQKLILENYERAKKLLTDNREKLVRLAETLIVWETLENQQVKDVVEGLDIGLPVLTVKVKEPVIAPVVTEKAPVLDLEKKGLPDPSRSPA
jgi:cell division protease FtsH